MNDGPIFLPGEARIDKLVIVVHAIIGYPDADTLQEYLESLGHRGCETPGLIIETTGYHSTRRVRIAPGWLISGQGDIRNVGRPNGDYAHVSLSVDANPTRFRQHHAPEMTAGTISDLPAEEAMLRNAAWQREAELQSCNGQDNVLIGAARNGGTCFDGRAQQIAQWDTAYLRHVEALLRSWLIPSATNALPPLTVTVEIESVRSFEVYWEFENDDAVSAVLTLADRMQSAAGNALLRRYMPDQNRIETGQARNGALVKVDLSTTSGNLALVGYSKTHRRVRFEVRYLDRVRHMIDRYSEAPRSIDGVLALLQEARVNAARRMETFMSALTAIAPVGADRADLSNLLRALVDATRDELEAADRIIAWLQLGGVFVSDNNGPTPRRLCERLKQRGIFQHVQARQRGPRRYAVTPRYAGLMEALLGALPARADISNRTTDHY